MKKPAISLGKFKKMSSEDVAALAIISMVFIVIFVGVVVMADKKACVIQERTGGTGITGNVISELSPSLSSSPQSYCYDSDAIKGLPKSDSDINMFTIPGYVTNKAISEELVNQYANGNNVKFDSCNNEFDLVERYCDNGKFQYRKVNCRTLFGSNSRCLNSEAGAHCAFLS